MIEVHFNKTCTQSECVVDLVTYIMIFHCRSRIGMRRSNCKSYSPSLRQKTWKYLLLQSWVCSIKLGPPGRLLMLLG